MSRKGFKHLSEEEFRKLKFLQDAAISAQQATKIMGRSHQTVNVVYKSETFAEYRDRVRAINARTKAPTVILTEQPQEVPTEAVAVPDALERIALALERLADAWEQSPTQVKEGKKRIFHL